MKRVIFGLVVIILVGTFLSACNGQTATGKEQAQTNRVMSVLIDAQPAPVFDWSLERYLLIELYKARNSAVSTYSYVFNDYLGKIVWSCPSVGYPVPGGTQLTNPDQLTFSRVKNGNHTETIEGSIPQVEPNGLYTPATSAGTYVMCVNDDGTVSPVYEERNVSTFFRPMEVKDGQLVPVAGVEPTIKINIKNQH